MKNIRAMDENPETDNEIKILHAKNIRQVRRIQKHHSTRIINIPEESRQINRHKHKRNARDLHLLNV